MTTATGYAHIVRDDDGHLRVGAGWHKVIMLVGEHVSLGSGPVEPVAAQMCERYAAWRREGWADTWNGIILMDGPGVDAPINRLDRLYHELADMR